MTDILFTTPVKANKSSAVNRKDMEKHIPEDGLKPCPKFCRRRLNRAKKIDALAANDNILSSLAAFRACDKTSYAILAQLMNAISRAVHATLSNDTELIVFVEIHAKNMSHHPNDYFASRPDLVAVLESIYDALLDVDSPPSWHHIVSLVEEKTKIDMHAGPAQCGTYLGLANQARPDMTGMFGLAACPKSYQIQYSCGSGIETSIEYCWDDLKPILSYVYTLYSPKTGQVHYDRSISLSSGISVADGPTWDVKAGETTYRNCSVKMVGDPWHRMTWIALADGDSPFVIKDSYRSEDSSFIEGELFDILHEEGLVSGFPDIVDSFEVVDDDGRGLIVKVRKCKRTKTRLVMATSGDPLHHCPSVLALLKVMYDVLEAHRFAVGEKNILHRDISFANILINPRSPRKAEKLYEGANSPKFITQVLNGKIKMTASLALLIDLDSAAEYLRHIARSPFYRDHYLRKDQQFRERTGTPRYIARSVAAGRILTDGDFEPMPQLQGKALDCYREAYTTSTDPLRRFNDTESTTHGGRLDNALRRKYKSKNEHERDLKFQNFQHHPRHDAESVFWCILVFLLQAMPEDPKYPEDVNKVGFNDFWRCIAEHEIHAKSARDSRNDVFKDMENFVHYLHQDLSFVAPLLYELAEQVQPEYALLDPPPAPLHLHEAMQRILFKYIHQWEAEHRDVKLLIKSVRSTIVVEKKERAPVKLPTYHGQNPLKRAAEAVEKLEVSPPKRQRIDSGYTSNASLSDASFEEISSDDDEC